MPVGGFERFSLKAQTNVVGGTIALTGANLEIDGNPAEGVLTFATDGRQTLQGTLAADSIDLTPYLSTIRLLTDSEREWSRVPISLDGISGFELDLRLSAAKIAIGTAKLGRTAIAANLRGGKLTLTVGESRTFGGVIKGSLGLATADAGAEFKSQLQFTDIDLEPTLSELFGVKRLEGKGDLAFVLEGTGRNVLALTRTLNGTATLAGRQGALTGLNLEQLLRRLERRPLSGGSEFRSGRTPFDKLTVALKITDGNAAVETSTLEGAAVKLALAGSGLDPGARSRPQGHCEPGHRARDRRPRAVRTALRGAGPVGRSAHAARSGNPDPALGRGGAPARCRARPPRARGRARRDRAADRRQGHRRADGGRQFPRPAGSGRRTRLPPQRLKSPPNRPRRIDLLRGGTRLRRAIIRASANHRPTRPWRGFMLGGFLRTLVKVAVASLIVGTILAHFGITADKLIREAGITPEQVAELGRRALDWALPNVLLGALVIVPVWFVVYLFRPPGARSD